VDVGVPTRRVKASSVLPGICKLQWLNYISGGSKTVLTSSERTHARTQAHIWHTKIVSGITEGQLQSSRMGIGVCLLLAESNSTEQNPA
jgi:hypothetical protein